MTLLINGDIITSTESKELKTIENGWILIQDGIIKEVSKEKPKIKADETLDYKGKLITPGLSDLHIHAPQYQYAGLHMDLELLDWLNSYTFPEESKYKDIEYADKAYSVFVRDLKNSETTRASIFGTIHKDADLLLAKKLEEAGLCGFVGKVNMDRNSPEYLVEKTDESIKEAIDYIKSMKRFKNIKPIITPRFTPSCSDELMAELGKIATEEDIPVQSHLDENLSEIEWIKELCPWAKNYSDTYDKQSLFRENKTIMAHVVWPNDEEVELLKKKNIYVAHSPSSNANLSSGIAPVKMFLEKGIKTGLASDIAGGSTMSMFRVMTEAITQSKLRWRYVDNAYKGLTFKEAFYLATYSSGSFFGKVGAIEKGYDADILVIDDKDSQTKSLTPLTLEERLEWYSYRTPGDGIIKKLVKGKEVF